MEKQVQHLPDVSEVKVSIRRFVIDNFLFGAESAELTDGTSFLQSGVIDSTGILELIQFVEATFQIQVGDTETVPENLDSLNNTAGYVLRKMEEAGNKPSP